MYIILSHLGVLITFYFSTSFIASVPLSAPTPTHVLKWICHFRGFPQACFPLSSVLLTNAPLYHSTPASWEPNRNASQCMKTVILENQIKSLMPFLLVKIAKKASMLNEKEDRMIGDQLGLFLVQITEKLKLM